LRHAKDESKPETASVYKGRGKSLNVNRFLRTTDAGCRLVYNEVPEGAVEVDRGVRGLEKPSDHAPTWIELDWKDNLA
jgi:hypothetical protein